jgi:transposase
VVRLANIEAGGSPWPGRRTLPRSKTSLCSLLQFPTGVARLAAPAFLQLPQFNPSLQSAVLQALQKNRSALTLSGVRAPLMIEGAIDSPVLEHYVEQMLVPELRAGDIVVWDNVPTHKNGRVLALIEEAGARVEPLPAYSPDFNSIEECISKVKAELRRQKAETARQLSNALKQALAKVTRPDVRGWFKHCGSVVPLNTRAENAVSLLRQSD